MDTLVELFENISPNSVAKNVVEWYLGPSLFIWVKLLPICFKKKIEPCCAALRRYLKFPFIIWGDRGLNFAKSEPLDLKNDHLHVAFI